MFIEKLFKPKWQHKNPQIRKQALQQLRAHDTQGIDILIRVAKEDEIPDVRRVALKRINNIEILREIALQDRDESVRNLAYDRFRQLLTNCSYKEASLQKRLEVFESVTDEKLIEHIAKYSIDVELRLSAVPRVCRESLLGDIACCDSEYKIRKIALSQISQKSTLERVLKTTRSKDKRISSQVKEKLSVLIAEQERPGRLKESARQLCISVENMAVSKNWQHEENRFKEVKDKWQSIVDDWDEEKYGVWESELTQRFNSSCRTFVLYIEGQYTKEKQLRELELLQEPLKAKKRELCEKLEALIAVFQDREYPLEGDKNTVVNTMTEIRSEAESLDRLPEVEESVFSVRLDYGFKELENYQSEMDSYFQYKSVVEKIEEQIDQLLNSTSTLNTKKIDGLDQKWLRQRRPDTYPGSQKIGVLVDDKIQSLKDRYAAQQQQVEEAIQNVKHAIEKMEKNLASGKTKLTYGNQRNIQKTLKQLSPSNSQILRRDGYMRRFHAATKQLQNLHSWKEWSTTPVKEQLVYEMETLVSELKEQDCVKHDSGGENKTFLDINSVADQISDARSQWKKLGASDPKTSQQLWEKFDAACSEAYKPCKVYFEEQAQWRNDNADKRSVVCKELENFINRAEWERMDWKRAETILRVAQDEWRNIGTVDRKLHTELKDRFHLSINTLRKHIGDNRESNREKKDGLLKKISNIVDEIENAKNDSAEIQQIIESVKKLQSEWKYIGPATKEHKLWKNFRSQCDVVFSKRQLHKEEVSKLLNENLSKKAEICGLIDSLAKLEGEGMKTARVRYEQAKLQWSKLGAIPKSKEVEYAHKFKQTCRYFEKQDQARAAKERHSQLDLLIEKANLCNKLDDLTERLILQTLNKEQVTTEMQNVQKVWQELPSLEDQVEKKIEYRFQEAIETTIKFSKDDASVQKKQIKAKVQNTEDKSALCLCIEILTDTTSPPSDRQARMKFQISQLASRMQQGGFMNEQEKKSADQEEMLDIIYNWFFIGPATNEHKNQLNMRFDRAKKMALSLI